MSTEKKNKRSSTKPKTETLIYCGPSIRKVGLQRFAVFRGELPGNIEKFIDTHPIIKELFVPSKMFPKFKVNVERVGTRENQLYTHAKKIAEGGKS